MKRVVLRIGCGAVCTALALTLGCGCALLPPATGVPGAASSAVSVPTDDSGKPLYDPTVLNDSRLRVLYCDGRFGSRDRKSTRLNSSHSGQSRMPSSA